MFKPRNSHDNGYNSIAFNIRIISHIVEFMSSVMFVSKVVLPCLFEALHLFNSDRFVAAST